MYREHHEYLFQSTETLILQEIITGAKVFLYDSSG